MQPTEEEQYYEHWLNETKQKAADEQRAKAEADRQYWEQKERDDALRWQQSQSSASGFSSDSSYDYSGPTTGYSSGGGYSRRTSGLTSALIVLGMALVICMLIWGPAGGVAHLLGMFRFAWNVVKGIWNFFASIFRMNVYFGIAVVVGILCLLKKLFG